MKRNEKQGVRSLENEHKEDGILMVDIKKMLDVRTSGRLCAREIYDGAMCDEIWRRRGNVEKTTDVQNASTHRQTNASPATSPTRREVSADVFAIDTCDTRRWRRRL
jgi:hypothetical protein